MKPIKTYEKLEKLAAERRCVSVASDYRMTGPRGFTSARWIINMNAPTVMRLIREGALTEYTPKKQRAENVTIAKYDLHITRYAINGVQLYDCSGRRSSGHDYKQGTGKSRRLAVIDWCVKAGVDFGE